MTTKIGIVKVIIGTATATDIDGARRNLSLGDEVYANEVITTGNASAIEIEFSDGTLMDLGRNTQALLDSEAFDPQQPTIESASEVDVLALQDALIDGEDPTQQRDATAAGPENEGNDGGISTVIVEHISPITEITSGFETTATVSNFLDDSSLFGDTISPLSLALQTASPQNDITITVADTANVIEDSTLTVDAAHGVLSNDSNSTNVLTINTYNVAGDSTTYTAGSTATISGIGTFTLNIDGSYQFIPEANYNGPVPTTTYITNTGASNTLALNVIPANDRPVVSDVEPQEITGEIVLNGTLTTSVDYWNFTHNGGDISIDMLTEISGPFNQNGTNGAGYNEINGDNTQTSLDVMIRVYSLNPDGSRGAQVGVSDDNNNPGFDGSLYNRDSFLALNNLPQGDYQLVVGAWNLTAAEVDSGINTVDATTWHFEGPYQITLNSDHGAQLKAKGIAFEAKEGDTLFESSLPAVSDADITDTHDYFIVATSETLSQSNPLGIPIAMPIITVNTDGSYSVSGDFNSLAAGETATVTFQYIADDKHGFNGTDGINESSISTPATVSVTIQGTNDSPIAFVDTATTTENLHISVDVLANDTDIDNGDDSSSFHLDSVSFFSGLPANSTATVSIVNNQLVFDPGTDFDYLTNGATASVIVNYTMSDDSGATSSSTATITVTGITNAPVITQALDDNTVSGTHDSAVSLKIFILDLAGNTISEHDAIVNADGTWSADFTKPAVGDYTMTAVAYDGPNGTGNASDVSNAINVNVGSTYQNIVDTDDAINIVFDGAGSNTLSTGAGDDLFVVGRGNDTFNAGAGNDSFIVEGINKGTNTFNGGADSDTIQGGAGDDRIGLSRFDASNSIETIDGGAGNNVIQGATYANLDFSATTLHNISEIRDGNGSNTITGNDQDITYRVGRGNDTFNAGAGDDTFLVANNSGTNRFNGGAGIDTIQAEEGVDSIIRLSATNSIEIVDGGLASDFNVLQGATYSNFDLTSFSQFRDIDEVRDGNGSNIITGNDQDITYRVGRGNDTFNAGAGDDTFIVEGNNKGSNTFNGGAGTDTVRGGTGDDIIGLATFSAANAVEIIAGGAGNNVIQGATYANLDFSATALQNITEIRDGNGSNTITGNDQDTSYRVGRGNDTFNAGTGDDSFIIEGFNKGANVFNGGAGNDTIKGGTGNDIIGLSNFNTGNSIEVIDGGAGTNVIQGATYSNLDFSTTSLLNISEIRGGNGSNTIIGSQSDDVIDGGRGNDSITGGTGNDILTGGTGNDLFIWNSTDVGTSSAPSLDTVTDFSGSVVNPGARSQDVLDLSDLLSDGSHTIEGLAENNTGGAGQHLQLAIKDVATNTVVQTIDLNNVAVNVGDNTSDMLNNLLANGGINDGI